MPRIAQISDLHLQSAVPARQTQIEPILQAINDAKPDLVVISGDVTDDGWDSIDELRWAKQWLDERIKPVWFAVPGNHDVGNFVTLSEGKIEDSRVQQWRNIFDPPSLPVNFGVLGDWAIIGVNSMLFGSNSAAERASLDRLERELKLIAKGLPYLVTILHSPLFIDQPDESPDPSATYWLGPIEARNNIWNRLKKAGAKLIASGHVHQTRLVELDGVQIAWAPPASGTWVHAPGLPNPPMPKETGFLMHHLGDDGSVRTETVLCAPMLKLYHHNP